MSYNNYMYGIERSDEYLEHYGIKGMKWGVRKAARLMTLDDKRTGGRSYQRGEKMMARQYRKAQKKLAKLQKRANSGSKYARRAAALGAGAAAAGGLAALGTGGVSSIMRKGGIAGGKIAKGAGSGIVSGSKNLARIGDAFGNTISTYGKRTGNGRLRNIGIRIKGASARAGMVGERAGKGVYSAGSKITGAGVKGGMAVRNWGNSNSVGKSLQSLSNKAVQANPGISKNINRALKNSGHSGLGTQVNKLAGVSNNTLARLGAGAIGAGLAAGAGYNAYRAASTKRAARKAAEFQREMNQAFKGTQYANGSSNGRKRKRNRK